MSSRLLERPGFDEEIDLLRPFPLPKGFGRTSTGGVFVTGDDPRPCIRVGRGPDAFGYGCGDAVCCAIAEARELDVETGFCPLGRRDDVGVMAATEVPFDQVPCEPVDRITAAACAFAIVVGVSCCDAFLVAESETGLC